MLGNSLQKNLIFIFSFPLMALFFLLSFERRRRFQSFPIVYGDGNGIPSFSPYISLLPPTSKMQFCLYTVISNNDITSVSYGTLLDLLNYFNTIYRYTVLPYFTISHGSKSSSYLSSTINPFKFFLS